MRVTISGQVVNEPQQRYIAVESDNLVGDITFVGLPTLSPSQLVTLHWVTADGVAVGDIAALTAVSEGWKYDITNALTQCAGRMIYAYVQVQAGEQEWHSQPFRIGVAKLPGVGAAVAPADPTIIDQMLAAMQAHSAAMEEQETRVEGLVSDADAAYRIVQAQVDALVVEGDSSVEAAQARVRADGQTFGTLRDRLNNNDSIADTVVFLDRDFPMLAPETDDTARIQRAIDALTPDTQITDPVVASITIPQHTGGKIVLSNGIYHVSTLRIKDMIELEGAGIGATQIEVSGSILYETAFATSFYAAWGITIRDMRITGAEGTEVLVGPGAIPDDVSTSTVPRAEQIMVECKIENVLFEHGHIGLDLRGWNNEFSRLWFRDLDIAVNTDAAKKRVNPNVLTANCDDNLFSRCTFNNIDISIIFHNATGNVVLDCAGYKADYVHYIFGESTHGNIIIGGRVEDAPECLVLFDGGRLVKCDDVVYKCIVNHVAGATNEPGVGEDWEDYWEVNTFWDTDQTWVSGNTYSVHGANGNRIESLNLYRGEASRAGRNGTTIARSAGYRAIKMMGDQFTRIRDSRSGGYIQSDVEISDKSSNAILADNSYLSAVFAGTGSKSYSESYQDGSTRIQNHNSKLMKGYNMLFEGDTENAYWTYSALTPRRYSFRTNSNVMLEARETSGVVHLPKQAFIKTLAAGATYSDISLVNVSATDVALLTPRNATAAAFYAANAASVYAAPEENTRIRIYHPDTVPADCIFNVVLL